MWSNYSNHTTCIQFDNLDVIKKEIISLLEKELGASQIHDPSSLNLSQKKHKNKNFLDRSSEFWIFELFEGNDGWTVIKTYPNNLLCHQIFNQGHSRPVLSALAVRLGCHAFHISVYESIFGILVEANASDQVYVSGVFDAEVPNNSFYKQPINSPKLIEQFSLLNVSEKLQLTMRVNKNLEFSQKEAEYKRLKVEKNPNHNLLITLENEVFQGHTERIDKALGKEIIDLKYWCISNLLNKMDTLPKESIEVGTDLFYFQSPPNYKIPYPYTLTRSQWLEIFGIEPPLDD